MRAGNTRFRGHAPPLVALPVLLLLLLLPSSAATEALLRDNANFGAAPGQIVIMKQEKVRARCIGV